MKLGSLVRKLIDFMGDVGWISKLGFGALPCYLLLRQNFERGKCYGRWSSFLICFRIRNLKCWIGMRFEIDWWGFEIEENSAATVMVFWILPRISVQEQWLGFVIWLSSITFFASKVPIVIINLYNHVVTWISFECGNVKMFAFGLMLFHVCHMKQKATAWNKSNSGHKIN